MRNGGSRDIDEMLADDDGCVVRHGECGVLDPHRRPGICADLGRWEFSAELAPGKEFMLMSGTEIATLIPIRAGMSDAASIPPQIGIKYAGE